MATPAVAMSDGQDAAENNRRAERDIVAPSKVLGMYAFGSQVYVACEGGVYLLERDELVPVRWLVPARSEVRRERLFPSRVGTAGGYCGAG